MVGRKAVRAAKSIFVLRDVPSLPVARINVIFHATCIAMSAVVWWYPTVNGLNEVRTAYTYLVSVVKFSLPPPPPSQLASIGLSWGDAIIDISILIVAFID